MHRTKKLLVRSTSVGSYLIIFTWANRVDPDQAALTRAAWSESALFAKMLKGVSKGLKENFDHMILSADPSVACDKCNF